MYLENDGSQFFVSWDWKSEITISKNQEGIYLLGLKNENTIMNNKRVYLFIKDKEYDLIPRSKYDISWYLKKILLENNRKTK